MTLRGDDNVSGGRWLVIRSGRAAGRRTRRRTSVGGGCTRAGGGQRAHEGGRWVVGTRAAAAAVGARGRAMGGWHASGDSGHGWFS
uniref:Uncharacterized protein n=1 Tax=Oryza rufipogon TaxID=4529 RepID=A0A0E0RCK0_ORYRU